MRKTTVLQEHNYALPPTAGQDAYWLPVPRREQVTDPCISGYLGNEWPSARTLRCAGIDHMSPVRHKRTPAIRSATCRGWSRLRVEQALSLAYGGCRAWALAPDVLSGQSPTETPSLNAALKSAAPPNSTPTPPPLTNYRLPRYHSSSLLYGADLGFHAEWLRDEP